jgi:hypothetical protein
MEKKKTTTVGQSKLRFHLLLLIFILTAFPFKVLTGQQVEFFGVIDEYLSLNYSQLQLLSKWRQAEEYVGDFVVTIPRTGIPLIIPG